MVFRRSAVRSKKTHNGAGARCAGVCFIWTLSKLHVSHFCNFCSQASHRGIP